MSENRHTTGFMAPLVGDTDDTSDKPSLASGNEIIC